MSTEQIGSAEQRDRRPEGKIGEGGQTGMVVLAG